jgi:hypothetical protein
MADSLATSSETKRLRGHNLSECQLLVEEYLIAALPILEESYENNEAIFLVQHFMLLGE